MTATHTPTYDTLTPPAEGTAIRMTPKGLQVPDDPIIPFIEGDGTGPDIWRASRMVLEGAVQKAYGGKRRLVWLEVLAGEKSKNKLDNWLPDDTLKAINHYLVAIKGPLTTPVGGGSGRSMSPCGRSWTCSPASGRCAGSRASPPRSSAPRTSTW